MIKCTVSYLFLLFIIAIYFIGSPLVARINAEVDGDECRIISIRYEGIDNYIYAQGNCEELFSMCTEDYCEVEEIDPHSLSLDKRVIGAE